jgi:hypothetical protein
MLNPDRKYFLTASIAHRAMAGFELELAGRSMIKPDIDAFDEIKKHYDKTNENPLVGDIKTEELNVTGKEITAVCKYLKAIKPVFSDGMESVAREIAMNAIFKQRDDGLKTKDMERGNDQEGEAVIALQDKINIEFTNTLEDQTFLTKGNLGVTPDAIEYNDFIVKSCGEVKNPKDTTHMKYLATLKDQKDMLKECPDYYWQAMAGLEVTNAEVYHWASYQNGAEERYQLVYVPIYPVSEHIEMLKIRAERISKRVPVIIEEIKSRYLATKAKEAITPN